MNCLMRCGMPATKDRDICAGCIWLGKADGAWRDAYVSRGGQHRDELWPQAKRIRQGGLVSGAKSHAEAMARREAA